MASTPTQPSSGAPRSLTGLLPFLRPYRARIALSVVFLVLAALATLAFPLALRNLVDGGLVNPDKGAQTMALRNHFEALFAVAVALGVFSAARFYMVSSLGEQVTADLRNAVYGHVLQQSPQFFETTQTGEVLSRLTTDTTLSRPAGREKSSHPTMTGRTSGKPTGSPPLPLLFTLMAR